MENELDIKAKKIKKVKKIKKRKEQNKIINKKPYSTEERSEKLRQDKLVIARRYEKMRLFDDAIKYYKALGLSEDIKRVSNIKMDVYLPKAREFEAKKEYEDAARLFENLKLEEDFKRVQSLMGEEESGLEPLPDDGEKISNTLKIDNKKNNKQFQICPYCGEELNLPKTPNFCPYCKEAFK